MSTSLAVTADLAFMVEGADGTSSRGVLHGSGQQLELHVEEPGLFAGRGDVPAIRGAAAALAAHGLTVRVVSDERTLVVLGRTRTGWVHRRLTGSRHMRVGSIRGALTSARHRSTRGAPVLPDATLVPPATPTPLAPTFLRRPRPPVTLTHDPGRGGAPRLVRAAADGRWRGAQPATHHLKDVTTIGSAAECDIRIAGLEPVHAEVRHDELDEFVLVHRARSAESRVNGVPVRRQVLRTGSRVEIGDLVLVFQREEFADHGRPFGGRIGGELGHQRSQPPQAAIAAAAGGPR